MNPEAISQVFFSIDFIVAPIHTAAALFATLPQGARHAPRMAPMLGGAALLAQLQAVCLDALHTEIDWTRETVVGASVRLEYSGHAKAGETVRATGFVVGIDDCSLAFQVDACVGGATVATGTLCFAIVARVRCGARAIGPAIQPVAELHHDLDRPAPSDRFDSVLCG